MLLFLLALPAIAQDTPPEPRPTGPTAVLTESQPVCHQWSAELILGLPTGVRLQKQFENRPLWFEAGFGIYGPLPTIFAGVRGEGRLIETDHNIIAVRPGLDLYYLQGYSSRGRGGYDLFGDVDVRSLGAAVLDFDLHWRCRWADSFHSQCGLKLGLGCAFGRQQVLVMPVLGLTIGCSF